MKLSCTNLAVAIAALGWLSLHHLPAQEEAPRDESSAAQKEEAAKDSTESAGEKAAARSRADLEKTFIETLTKATMQGRWCVIREGELTPEKDEEYHIESVAKLAGDSWVIHARIKYNDVDFVAPVPVKVEWAGDTPVIIVDNLQTPGGNQYSARVLVYEDTYAGTWSGKDVRGLLNGMISRPE